MKFYVCHVNILYSTYDTINIVNVIQYSIYNSYIFKHI